MTVGQLLTILQVTVPSSMGYFQADDEIKIQTPDGILHPVVSMERSNGAEEYLPTAGLVPPCVVIGVSG